MHTKLQTKLQKSGAQICTIQIVGAALSGSLVTFNSFIKIHGVFYHNPVYADYMEVSGMRNTFTKISAFGGATTSINGATVRTLYSGYVFLAKPLIVSSVLLTKPTASPVVVSFYFKYYGLINS